MASLRLEKEGRQRSLKEQQRKPDDDDSEDNQSQISDSPHPGLDPGGGRLIIDGYKKRAKKLSWSLLLAYAAPMIGAGGMNFTLTTFAAYFYTDTMGLPPGVVGRVQLCLMCMYAISEPIFGWVSDVTNGWIVQHCGRRKPFLAVSAFVHSVTFIALMSPPSFLTPTKGLKEWAFIFSILLGISWGCNEVTYQALGAQMTFDYDERTKLQAIAVSVITLGSTSCGLLHGVLGSLMGSSIEKTRERFMYLCIIYSLLFFIGTFFMLFFIKEENLQTNHRNNYTFNQWIWAGIESVQQMILNLPFFLLMLSYSCMIMAGAITPMLLPYYCKHIIMSPFITDWSPLLFTASAVLGMPIWVFLGSSYLQVEKKWRFVLAGAWVGFFLGLSALLVQPGDNILFICLSILGGLGMGGYFATPEAMKPDVVDYDEFRTGARHEARFAGVFMFFANISAGIGIELVLLLLDLLGYDGNKKIGEKEPINILYTIRIFYGCTLLFMLLFIIPCMAIYPITRQKHAEILQAIQKRMQGEYAADPLYGGPPLPPYENISLLNSSPPPPSSSSSSAAAAAAAEGGVSGDRSSSIGESSASTAAATTAAAAAAAAEGGNSASFLQQVGMEVGSLAGIHGDRTGIRNIP